jgi:hypothetical protein
MCSRTGPQKLRSVERALKAMNIEKNASVLKAMVWA